MAATAGGIRVRGAVITPDFGLFYRLKLDENGHARMVRIEHTDGRVFKLFSDDASN